MDEDDDEGMEEDKEEKSKEQKDRKRRKHPEREDVIKRQEDREEGTGGGRWPRPS